MDDALMTARGHDFISAVPWAYRGYADKMRAANPSLTLVTYMNGTLAFRTEESAFPAAWYLRDAAGSKIMNNWGLWVMDPANPDWRANRIAKCLNNMIAEDTDGCYVDNLGHGTIYPTTLTAQPVNPRTGVLYTEAEWIRDSGALIALMRDAVPPGTILFGNGLMNGSTYFRTDASASASLLKDLDIGCSETFVRIGHEAITKFRSEAAWKADVDMLVHATGSSRRIAAVTKVWVPASTQELDRLHEYALATFLLGDSGAHFFAFSTGMTMSPESRYDQRSRVRVGAPDGPYRRITSGSGSGLYSRTFDNGRALVNPSPAAVSIQLDAQYRGIDGDVVTGLVVLAPNTGLVLTR